MSDRDDFETLNLEQLNGVCGGIAPKLWTAMQKARELGLQVRGIHTGHLGGHAANSRHWRGMAVDIGGSSAGMAKFVAWAKGTRPHELIHKGLFIKDGRRIGGIGGHAHHVHYSI